jgi:hypothetical protein
LALAPFFERVWGALGGHLGASRESLNSVLEAVTVHVRCGHRLTENDAWISELTVNLLARLYPRLSVSGTDDQCSRLGDLARGINPDIELVSPPANAPTICVGSDTHSQGIYPSAHGWVARLTLAPVSGRGPSNPFAAGAAAAFACAELFRRVFLNLFAQTDLSVSLLGYDRDTGSNLKLSPTDVGDVLFAGVGAVGNAALWALGRATNTRGNLWLVDPEVVTLLNLQRYVLATHSDVGMPKVELGQRALSNIGLAVHTHRTTLEEFADLAISARVPTTAISVDNVDGRRWAQALLPRLVVNGWTGGGALGASWHVFSRDAACLACLYHPHGRGLSAVDQAAKAFGLDPERAALLWVTRQHMSEADIQTAAKTLGVSESVLSPWRHKSLGELYTDVVCGAVPLDLAGVGRLEVVPLAHQSALAGILMSAELIKRTSPKLSSLSQAETLVSWDDILKEPPTTWLKPRAREPGCICGDPDYQQAYKNKWRNRSGQLDKARASKGRVRRG